MSKMIRKTISAGLCAVLLCTLVLAGVRLDAGAVSYSGRGSKSDPYLVETAEQLQGMKDNLSAHYKLANTIDLTGIAFTPIGHQGSPFTGSFVCDLDSDGTPKHAIKNLSVTINGVPNYADYVKGKNKWQSALFGAATNATVTNIALVDVMIVNNIEGKNQMNADYTLNPGMDEMAVGALIGLADGVAVTGCSATGIINSRANHTGGLVGRLLSGEITKSYTKITFQQTGRWCNGGLIGSVEKGTIAECFADCDLSKAQSSAVGWGAGANTTSGLVGSALNSGVTVKNCYSVGTVCEAGNSMISEENGAFTGASDCYTTSKITGMNAVKSGTSTKNCFVLNSVGCVQAEFTAASEAEIKAAFSSNSAWDTSGALPVLKNVKVITNSGKYVPQAVTNPGGSASGGEGITAPTEAESSTAAADYAAKVADYLEKAQSGVLTLDEGFDAMELENVKAQMTAEEMIKLSEINPYINDDYDSLIAEVKLFLVSTTVSEIENLPTPEAMTEENAEKVLEVYALYQRLPEQFREAINDDTAAKIDTAYQKAYELKYVTIVEPEMAVGTLTDAELVLVITFGVICLAAFGGVVYTTVRFMIFLKKEKTKV